MGDYEDSVENINRYEAVAMGSIGASGLALVLGSVFGPDGVVASQAIIGTLGEYFLFLFTLR